MFGLREDKMKENKNKKKKGENERRIKIYIVWLEARKGKCKKCFPYSPMHHILYIFKWEENELSFQDRVSPHCT